MEVLRVFVLYFAEMPPVVGGLPDEEGLGAGPLVLPALRSAVPVGAGRVLFGCGAPAVEPPRAVPGVVPAVVAPPAVAAAVVGVW